MNTAEIVISRKLVYRIAIVLGVLIALLLAEGKFSIFDRLRNASNNTSIDSASLTAGSAEKFAMLSGRGTQGGVGST